MGQSFPNRCFSVLVRNHGLKDARTVVHSVKVGLALTLASFLVLAKHPYGWIGHNAIWAVLTVGVVFETSAGATLSKGLNRGIGTMLAGFLALGATHLADLFHEPGEPIFIGFMVFLAGTASTVIRSIPAVKRKFDYGIVIFMLTFCMIIVTGYRIGNEVKTASDRLLTIMIGTLICLVVSSFIIPHWAGEDLHRLSADKFDKLGKALEECVREYLSADAKPITSQMIVDQSDGDSIYEACREAVKARSTEEALAVFASWEPPHGKFGLGYPWKQYLVVGAVLRHCAYAVLALHGSLRSEIQAPKTLRVLLASELSVASVEGAAILHELADCIRNMRKLKSSPSDILQNVISASDAIKRSISRHSYLLATPESWLQVEDHLQQTRNLSFSPSMSELLPSSLSKSATQIHPQEQTCKGDGKLNMVSTKIKSKFSIQVHPLKEGADTQVKSADRDHEILNNGKAKPNGSSFDGRETVSKGHTAVTVKPNEGDSLSHSKNRASSSNQRKSGNAHFRSDLDVDNKLSFGSLIKTSDRGDAIASALSLVTFASLLVETLARLDHVVEAVDLLSKFGRFTQCTCGT